MGQLEELAYLNHSDALPDFLDEPALSDAPIPDPTADFLARCESKAAGVPASLDASLAKAARSFEERFSANRENPAFGSAAALAKTTRTETENGVERTFDEHNELIRARVTNGDDDRGEVSKRADIE